MSKRNIVFWTSMIFLFGQIAVLIFGKLYLGLFDTFQIAVFTLVWASAILCGYYSHWTVIYLKNHSLVSGKH